MKRIVVPLVAIILIGNINSYAAFPTFVWTEEFRSGLYAVEMEEEETGVEEDIVFDTVEDDPATPTDLDTFSPPDEGMYNAVGEEEPDSVAQSIASYDIELEAGEEDPEPEEPKQEG